MLVLTIMVILMILGMPVAFAMATSAVIYILFFLGSNMLVVVPQKMFYTVDSFVLLAVPFFMLAAELMNVGTITNRIFGFAKSLVGHLRGGLGYVNVIASMIFAGMSGSAVADAAGLGQIEIKAMNDEGYDRGFSAAITAASSTIGPIIPPSIPMVVFGVITGVSVGRLFAAGMVPGLMMGFGLMGIVYVYARIRRYPVSNAFSWAYCRRSLVHAALSLLLPIILMGGIVGGIFTPTEASVVSVAYAIVLTCFIYKEVSFRQVYETFKKVGVNCSIILFIVSTAGLIGQVANLAHLPQELSQFLFVVTDDRTVLILLILGLLLFLGCLLETLSLLIIMTPFLVPVMTTLGFSPTHMGITIILPTMIGLITPPVGLSMYIACEIAQVNMVTYTKEAFFFILILIIVCLLVAYFPALSISVSNLVFGPE